MKDEILRNGVPHNVTTSLVTHNAVLPQNIFIKEEASALRDSSMAGVVPSLVKQDSDSALGETVPPPPTQAAPDYPASQNKQDANDTLTTIKSHIRDNVQALKNLAHSDNKQHIPTDAFHQNNQGLGASRSIQDNKLYLEKKSIKSNRQLISQTTTQRSAAKLDSQHTERADHLSATDLENQASAFRNSENSHKDKQETDKESAFQMRIKELKGHVRNVDSTLQNLDPDK